MRVRGECVVTDFVNEIFRRPRGTAAGHSPWSNCVLFAALAIVRLSGSLVPGQKGSNQIIFRGISLCVCRAFVAEKGVKNPSLGWPLLKG